MDFNYKGTANNLERKENINKICLYASKNKNLIGSGYSFAMHLYYLIVGIDPKNNNYTDLTYSGLAILSNNSIKQDIIDHLIKQDVFGFIKNNIQTINTQLIDFLDWANSTNGKNNGTPLNHKTHWAKHDYNLFIKRWEALQKLLPEEQRTPNLFKTKEELNKSKSSISTDIIGPTNNTDNKIIIEQKVSFGTLVVQWLLYIISLGCFRGLESPSSKIQNQKTDTTLPKKNIHNEPLG